MGVNWIESDRYNGIVGMPIPFEFVIGGPPVSQQARRRELVRHWTQEVRSVARQCWDAEPPLSGDVAVTITYFYDRTPLDVDNIPKPILDALRGLVYSDDSQVSDLLCRKRDLHAELRIQNASTTLLGSLRDAEPILHIAVAETTAREVVL